ncbi:MAG: trigger factor, partial [Gemmatimonadota bacterium]|nr:trigger factor [Gemmatimonadota bacterium]
LRQEALDNLVSEAYKKALALKELRPISEGEIENINYRPEEDLVFSIVFDIHPEIEISRLGGFAVERPVTEVTNEHVDKVLDRIREQNGAWKPIEAGTPEDGNLVSVNIRRLDDDQSDEGREYEFILGQGDALPDIEVAIKSLELNKKGEFDISFPDDFPDEDRRGDLERIELTFLGRKELELPELDDDLAKQAGEFETLDDLKVGVRDDLQKEASNQAESVVRDRLLDLLVEANPFDVPVSMVDRYIDGVVGEESKNLEPDKLKEVQDSIRPEAEKAVKRILILEKIAETQSLAATDEEIDARITEIAEANDSTTENIYANLQKSGQLEMFKRELTEKKIFSFIEKQSEITDGTAA